MRQAANGGAGFSGSAYVAPLRYRALTRFYDLVVATTTRSREWIARVATIAAVRPGERVLDVGCGTGTLLAHLERSGGILFGVDADTEALALARSKAGAAGSVFARGFAQRLPFPEAAFDVVVSSLFFHHLGSKTKHEVLQEIRRVMHPEARLVIADWGLPASRLSRAGFCLVQLLDGFDTTRDSVQGTMPHMIVAAGFDQPREHPPLSTLLGTIRFWETSPSAS